MSSQALTGLLVATLAITVASAFGLWRRARDGRLREVRRSPHDAAVRRILATATGASGALTIGAVTVGTGAAVTLVQFSSAFCGPCRTVSARCADLAAGIDAVRHVEIDAADHLDAARVLGIWRTPTVLVVDGQGRVVKRASGVPSAADLRAAVEPLLAGV